MMISSLFDPFSGAIVVGGTLVGAMLQCGFSDSAKALGAVARLARPPFDPLRARAELASHVKDIRQDGVVRGHKAHLTDREFEEATEALIGGRSVSALIAKHEDHRARRGDANQRAQATLAHAAELAPVFGLAGTLISLTRLADGNVLDGALSAAIGTAVMTTLYGLLFAHLVLAPLAHAVERAGRAEEAGRQEVIGWLANQLEGAIPRSGPRRPRAVA